MNHNDEQDRISEVKKLYQFVAQQVIAGLFKSDIIDKLIELGVSHRMAFDLLEEMERRMKNLRKRAVVLVMSDTPARAALYKDFHISGYDVSCRDRLQGFSDDLIKKVPDLVVVDAFDVELRGRDVLQTLRSDIIGRDIPVFVLSDESLREEEFVKWQDVKVLQKPCPVEDVVQRAREFFLKQFRGDI